MITRFVLMGVSGCGKTSVGEALADRLALTFIDGDDLHPAANIAKMTRGEPLNDADRAPWLAQVGHSLARQSGTAGIGCSSLKRSYRDIIRNAVDTPVYFLHLHAAKPVLAERVSSRDGHFMPPALLDSQFDALELLQSDEAGTIIDIDQTFDRVVAQAETYIKETME